MVCQLFAYMPLNGFRPLTGEQQIRPTPIASTPALISRRSKRKKRLKPKKTVLRGQLISQRATGMSLAEELRLTSR
jgi:hypothetical protein